MASPTAQTPPVSASSSSSKKFSTISAFVNKSSNGTSSHQHDHNDRSAPSVRNIFGGTDLTSDMPNGNKTTKVPSNSRGEDGPWSVSVAAADPAPVTAKQQESSSRGSSRRRGRHSNEADTANKEPAYTLYITTPTHNLTLQRTITDILELDVKIRDGQSSISSLPQLPKIPNASTVTAPASPPPTGSRKFLQTISRTLSPGGSRNRVALGQITSSLAGGNSSAPPASSRTTPSDYGSKSSSTTKDTTLKMPKPRRGYVSPFSNTNSSSNNNHDTGDQTRPSPAAGADSNGDDAATGKKVTSALAEYFTTLANIPAVRKSKPFRRFVRVGSEDLQSIRVERRIHRVRSDLAKHVKHSVAPRNTNVGANTSQSDIGDDAGRTDDERDAGSISARSASRQSNIPNNSSPTAALLRPGSSSSDRGSPKVPARSTSADSAAGTGAASSASQQTSPHLAGVANAGKRSSPNFAGIPEEADKEREAGSIEHATTAATSTGDMTALTTMSTASNIADTSADSSAMEKEPTKKRDRRRKRRDADKVTVDDFEMIRVLGKGCAGKVCT